MLRRGLGRLVERLRRVEILFTLLLLCAIVNMERFVKLHAIINVVAHHRPRHVEHVAAWTEHLDWADLGGAVEFLIARAITASANLLLRINKAHARLVKCVNHLALLLLQHQDRVLVGLVDRVLLLHFLLPFASQMLPVLYLMNLFASSSRSLGFLNLCSHLFLPFADCHIFLPESGLALLNLVLR